VHSTNTNHPVIVDDVVTALTADVGAGPDARSALRERMQRAMQEFDERTAEAFARALLDSLTHSPTDLRQLEALVILGFAHPEILDRHRISLHDEAERLVFLLERDGEADRAATVREMLTDSFSVHTEPPAAAPAPGAPGASGAQGTPAPAADERRSRVERCLRQADEAAMAGRHNEAIACLQEVLGLDPGRRDVGRMIRELRGRQREKRWRFMRHVRALCFTLLALGAVAWGVWREFELRREYGELSVTTQGPDAVLQANLASIDEFVAANHFWFGMHQALTDKQAIETALARTARVAQRNKHEARVALEERLLGADAARVRGLMYAQKGQYEQALVDFRQALELAPDNWEHRPRVQADLEAIEAFRSQTESRQAESRQAESRGVKKP